MNPEYIAGRFKATDTSGLHVCKKMSPKRSVVFVSDGQKSRILMDQKSIFVVEITDRNRTGGYRWGRPLFCTADLEERLAEVKWRCGHHDQPVTRDQIKIGSYTFRVVYATPEESTPQSCIRFVPLFVSNYYRDAWKNVLVSHDVKEIERAEEIVQKEMDERILDRYGHGP